MSAEDKKTGRRGAGRGRRQTPAQQEQIQPGPAQEQLQVSTSPPRPGVSGGRGPDIRGSPEQSSPEGVSPKGSPPGSDVDDKMKNLQIIDLAKRPGFGVVGQSIKVAANHFEVRLDKELNVVQYHVETTHDRLKPNRDEKRLIFWTCVTKNPNVFRSIFRFAYDGDHILLSLDQLKFGGKEGEGTFVVRVRLPKMEREEDFKVTVSATGYVRISLREARAAGTAERNTTPLHALDLIFRQKRSYPLEDSIREQWFSFASTVYKIPRQGGGADLSCGRVIWQGLFGAARVGQGFTPYINFDVSHSGFYRPQGVLQYLVEVLNEQFGNPSRGQNQRPTFSLDQLNAQTTLQPNWVKTFSKSLKGLKVTMRTKRANGEFYDHEYTVNGVEEDNAVTHRFPQKQPNGEVREISVAEYFQERYGPLKFPLLNLLHVGPRNRKCVVPMEHCSVSTNQRIKKLNSNETSSMIRAAAINATVRRDKILDLVQTSDFPQDPWLKEFGIRVNPQMKQVDARILQPPRIGFAKTGRQPVVEVREGVWDMRNQKFLLGATCQRIAALVLDDRDHQTYQEFFGFLLQTCAELGMNVPRSIPQNVIEMANPSNLPDIERALTKLKNAGAEFVIVTLPQKNAPIYSEVKRAAEISLGLMTQCVVKQNIRKCIDKRDRMTTTNIALKMNMKMGGVNSEADADTLAKKVLLDETTLVLGIDVTHPSPLEKKMPSISSVVGNMDDTFMRYGASIRVQKHRRESIVAGHLDLQVKDRLIEYNRFVGEQNRLNKTNKGTRPGRIIIFRDGVAEGQFQDVLREELAGIRQACKDLDTSYRPKVTLIIAQKRHHTRFFPGPQGPTSGKGNNIRPGTVVDKDITHPDMFEFYLCSHFGIQGTSRPIRYHVLHDDNNFSADHIQAMTYYLCHMFARCTRAVSLPAPVYYADLACRRARAHIFDKVSDFGSDTMSQRSGSGGETETQISEDELIRSSTVQQDLRMRMYFT